MKKIIGLFTATAVCVSAFALTSCNNNSVEGAGEELSVINLEDLKGEHIEVSFWHSFGDKISGPLDNLIEKFEDEMAEQGYDIDVKAESVGGGYDGLRSRVNQGTSSNAIPTMILGYPDHFADYISNGILLPLDDYINAKDPKVALENKDDFVASYWKENVMTIGGKETTVGIPFNKSTEIMVYNSNVVDPILSKLGYLDEGDTWGNPTWDEVMAVSAEILANKNNLTWTNDGAQYNGDSANIKYPVTIDSGANFFITTARQWGGDNKYTVATDLENGKIVFNNDTVKEAQEWFRNYAGFGSNAAVWQLPTKQGQNYGSNLLNNLQSFISIGSTAGIKNNESQKYTLKATTYPQKDGTETPAVIQQGTNAAILSANSNNKTRLAAWMLIKYLTNTENTAQFSIKTGYMPVRESAVNSDKYQSFLADPDNVFNGSVAKAINAAYAQKNYFYTDAPFTGSSVVRDTADTLIEDIYIYSKSVQDAINSAYKSLKDLGFDCE